MSVLSTILSKKLIKRALKFLCINYHHLTAIKFIQNQKLFTFMKIMNTRKKLKKVQQIIKQTFVHEMHFAFKT